MQLIDVKGHNHLSADRVSENLGVGGQICTVHCMPLAD